MAIKITLDHPGMAKLLKSAGVASAVRGLAGDIAAATSAAIPPDEDAEVVVDSYDGGDRAAASVTVKHPLARLWVARDGLLIRQAAGAGVEVTAHG